MMRKVYTFLAFLLLGTALFGADSRRIAVVDLEKVFREFYKSRIAEETIRQQAEVYRGYLLKQNEQLRRASQELREAESNSLNLALDENSRKQYEAQAEAKSKEMRERKAHIELYANEKSKMMREIELKKRGEIMAEIRRELDRRAAAEGYSFVVDSSGRSMNDQPFLLVFPSDADITASVITELNRTKNKVVPAAVTNKTGEKP